jgi:hypothetical protein
MPIAKRLSAAVLLALAGCAGLGRDAAVPLVREHAVKDLDCPDKDVRVVAELGDRYKAIGCGRKAVYRTACVALACEVRPEDAPPIGTRDRPDPTGEPAPR